MITVVEMQIRAAAEMQTRMMAGTQVRYICITLENPLYGYSCYTAVKWSHKGFGRVPLPAKGGESISKTAINLFLLIFPPAKIRCLPTVKIASTYIS